MLRAPSDPIAKRVFRHHWAAVIGTERTQKMKFTRHALFEIATIQEPTQPGRPTIAINADGQRYELVGVEG